MLISPASDNHWSLRAACREGDTWVLFDSIIDEVTGKDSYLYEEEAKALCATCPVFDDCKASSVKEPTNIWAGEIHGK